MKLIPAGKATTATIAGIIIGSVALVGCAPNHTSAETVSSLMTAEPTYTSSAHSVDTSAGTAAATTKAAEGFLGSGVATDQAEFPFTSTTASEQMAARSVIDAVLNDAALRTLEDSSYLTFDGTPSMGSDWGLSFGSATNSVDIDLTGDAVDIKGVDLTGEDQAIPELNAFYGRLTQAQALALEAGIPATEFTAVEQEVLVELVSTAVGISDPETTGTALGEIRATLEQTIIQGTPDALTLIITGPTVDFEVSHQGGVAKITYLDPSTDNLVPEERVDTAGVASAPPEVV